MLDYASSCCFFFFKQKTAYVMRISDSSSDVCSSDLPRLEHRVAVHQHERPVEMVARRPHAADAARDPPERVVDEIDRQRRRRGVEMRSIGRATCRERVCQYVSISWDSLSYQNTNTTSIRTV